MKILVIADDLTGAGEVAGIGWRYGLDASLYRGGAIPAPDASDGLTVIDSNTRDMPPNEAGATIGRLIAGLLVKQYDLIYKKTDSVLRGPVMAELEASLHALSFGRALFIPQNPSRGRCIRDRVYTIHDVPLHQTAFTSDPVHPVNSSDIHTLLGPPRDSSLFHIKAGDPLPDHGIITTDADNKQTVTRLANSVMEETLLAGGGDFFDALLSARIGKPSRSSTCWPIKSYLLVSGSLADRSNRTLEHARGMGLDVIHSSVYQAEPNSRTYDATRADITRHIKRRGGTVLTTPDLIFQDHGDRIAASSRLIDLTCDVLEHQSVDEVLATGGFTANLLMQRLGIKKCRVCGLWSDGVVRLLAADGTGPAITIKPGSYAWPDSIWNAIAEAHQGLPA